MVKQQTLERNWCSELVSVVRVSHGCAESIPGNLEEIGERMALVVTETQVPAGSRVHIACKSHVLRGIAKSCKADRMLGYLIEIRLAPASRWSRDWFAPEHLVTFREQQLRLSA
jgi:hypothetical protein